MSHPDPYGADAPETPTAARDGLAGNGNSIADRAEAEPPAPEPPPVEGDQQLTLAGLGPRSMAVEVTVSLMSAEVPGSGLLDPDREGQLIVAFAPAKYEYVPVRDGGRIVRWKLRQSLRPVHVMRPEQWEGFVEEQREFAERERAAALS